MTARAKDIASMTKAELAGWLAGKTTKDELRALAEHIQAGGTIGEALNPPRVDAPAAASGPPPVEAHPPIHMTDGYDAVVDPDGTYVAPPPVAPQPRE